MSTPAPTNWKYLEPRPCSLYRQLFIKGTRIRAELLSWDRDREDEPWSPEEIAEQYNLPLEAVKEALAYCDSNPPEIEDDHRREDMLAEASGMNDPNYDGRPKILTAEDYARIFGS
jgi:uncharacterized protein (DUF433 family)